MISFFNAINTYTDASLTTDKYGNTVTCSGFITTFQGKIIDQGRLVVVGSTNNYGEIMAIAHKEYPLVGLQFHPESIYTPDGMQLIENFVTKIK